MFFISLHRLLLCSYWPLTESVRLMIGFRSQTFLKRMSFFLGDV